MNNLLPIDALDVATARSEYHFVDLFAGCGGLSLGLARSNFESVLAVERSPMAAETYYHNLIGRLRNEQDWPEYLKRRPEEQIAAGLFVGPVEDLIGVHRQVVRTHVKRRSGTELDLVVGGPPCQGFSMAGRRDANDHRNRMPEYFLEVVKMLRPRAVVIENVAGFKMKFSENRAAAAYEVERALRDTPPGYVTQVLVLNAMHYGAPQHRPRTIIVGLRQDVADRLNVESSEKPWVSKWRSEVSSGATPKLAPVPTCDTAIECPTIEDAFHGLSLKTRTPALRGGREAYRNFIAGCKGLTVSHCKGGGLNNHILRKHSERVANRFRLYQILRRANISETVIQAASKAQTGGSSTDLNRILLGLRNVKFPLSSPDGELRINNEKHLCEIACELTTLKHSQRALFAEEKSPTVMTLPDDFVHPTIARTLTVREMARLQTFPDAFEFRSKETTGGQRRKVEVPQYTQVGNAVPPMLAAAIGTHLRKLLLKADRMENVANYAKVKLHAGIGT